MVQKIRDKIKRYGIFVSVLIVTVITVTSCTQMAAQEVTLVDITMEGGTGRAHIESPVEVTKTAGRAYAKLVWSSSNYDYVIVDGVKYDNENPGGASTFTVPVETFDEPLKITGDTVAMSSPHEIEYTIFWNSSAEQGTNGDESIGADKRTFGEDAADQTSVAPAGLEKTGEVPLKYAKGFKIDLYGDYTLIDIYGVGAYLMVPEGKEAPGGVNVPDGSDSGNSSDGLEDITILTAPFDATYLVSTSAMDLVRECGCLDRIRFSPLRADDWYIDEAKERMMSGDMVYAGKYRTPDYELLVGGGCDLAVENTMIYHDPEVMEKLTELGIPVIVETSSYEKETLGRLEWIKLYGVLFGKPDEAEKFFDAEAERVEAVEKTGMGDTTVAFFSLSSTGMVSVRRPGDYMVKLIELAGGRYVPKRGMEDEGTASMNMQMEDFYAGAKNADVLIYNSTIEDELEGISYLTEMNGLFADFKAVKENNVYCLRSGFFQNTTKMADLIEDLDKVLSGSPEGMKFLYKLE